MAHLIHSVLPMPPRKLVCIGPEVTIKKCVELMAANNIGALVVLDDDQKLIGIVSERDIIHACLNKGCSLNDCIAKDIAYKDVTILSPHDIVEKAMKAVTETKRRHVLIYDKGRLLAILSIGDLLFHLLDDKARVIEQLENYIAR